MGNDTLSLSGRYKSPKAFGLSWSVFLLHFFTSEAICLAGSCIVHILNLVSSKQNVFQSSSLWGFIVLFISLSVAWCSASGMHIRTYRLTKEAQFTILWWRTVWRHYALSKIAVISQFSYYYDQNPCRKYGKGGRIYSGSPFGNRVPYDREGMAVGMAVAAAAGRWGCFLTF